MIERGLASAIESLRSHWPEYLMEAGEMALYLFFMSVFARLFLYPASSIRHVIGSAARERAIMGLAVGTTVVAIAVSPWGKQSGGHFNPAVTLAFYRLGKIGLPDVLFYIAAQF